VSRRTLHRTVASAVLSATLVVGAGPASGQSMASTDDLADLIRERIETAARGGSATMLVGDERIHAAAELPTFYRGRDFQPAWVNDLGPRAVADSLLWAVEGAVLEGLESNHYHLIEIRDIYADVRQAARTGLPMDQGRLAELDLLMTDAFLVYAAHLSSGRVDPTTIHPEWTASRAAADVVAELDMALATGRVAGTLHQLLPVHPGYERLRAALADHRRVAGQGGWPVLPGRTLGPGMKDPAVALLRARLRMSNDLPATVHARDEELYDEEIEAAVRRFQTRHAIEPDGVVRLETSAMLNIPVEDRIRQIELNLERWRWLPQELGERHIRVNIAGFDMHVMEGDSAVFRSRVLVGQRYRATPVFSDVMTYLVLNPTWTIPPGILEEDKLPLIRRDVSYLARNNIKVIGSDGRAVNPASVDFDRVTGRTAYRFRMDPGRRTRWAASSSCSRTRTTSTCTIHRTTTISIGHGGGELRLHPCRAFHGAGQIPARRRVRLGPGTHRCRTRARRPTREDRPVAGGPAHPHPLLDRMGRTGWERPLPLRHLRSRRAPRSRPRHTTPVRHRRPELVGRRGGLRPSLFDASPCGLRFSTPRRARLFDARSARSSSGVEASRKGRGRSPDRRKERSEATARSKSVERSDRASKSGARRAKRRPSSPDPPAPLAPTRTRTHACGTAIALQPCNSVRISVFRSVLHGGSAARCVGRHGGRHAGGLPG